ncbi:MAG: hypothetical protein LW688_11705 [Cryomorphaceae bacterium]|nr:hypothetical protein [Cryomorphaceae bacterium]
MKIQTDKWFFRLLWIVLLTAVIGLRDWNSRFERPINGDGKGYYAYLPAVFIYHDAQFGFIEEIETKYYPLDRSQFKNFLNKQPNGRVVNKTFPGLALLYAPFFFLAWLIAWIGGFVCDGYSLPFQMSISIAHVVYLMLGLRAIYETLSVLKIGIRTSLSLVLILVFASNVWYYILYDHSVGHVFSFFLCALFCRNVILYFQSKKTFYFSVSLVLLALMVSIRPTNAMMLLFMPLLSRIAGTTLFDGLRDYLKSWREQWKIILICSAIVALSPVVWYWQTGNFVVYSYGKETFDFLHPHFVEFLFSFEKGWFLWSPGIFLMVFITVVLLVKKDFLTILSVFIPFSFVVYVLSSWWCWTYGDGFGQRPVIEFLPFVVLVFGVGIMSVKREIRVLFISLFFPFCCLSLFQGFQIHEGIHRGGTTTKSMYLSHFFQWYTDAPKAHIPLEYIKVFEKNAGEFQLSEKFTYSKAIKLPVKDISLIELKAEISGKHKDTNVRIVLSSKDSKYYKSEFTGMYIYNFDRLLSYSFSVENCQSDTLLAYLWNGDSNSKVSIRSLRAIAYKR